KATCHSPTASLSHSSSVGISPQNVERLQQRNERDGEHYLAIAHVAACTDNAFGQVDLSASCFTEPSMLGTSLELLC
ncbi:MAG: hypothetical protein QOF56_2243, partial [Acidobacteriaceae bacterium]|nr:hypothetical protein [Acidobacteriaceae bacterium]